MKVLFLGYTDSPLIEWLKSKGEEIIATANPIDLAFVETLRPEFIISYGYNHIIKKEILDRFVGNAINLHISYLPFNRGADPNLWSFVEDSPRGVTIHYLDEGVDTGDIIVQEQVSFSRDETLRTSYNKLQNEVQRLFKESWAKIRVGKCDRRKQEGVGCCHRLKDKEKISGFLTSGWDTPVDVLARVREKD